MDGVMRRREMVLPSAPLPEWDYEWDYTQGLPDANGWTKVVSGTATATLQSNGVKLANASVSSYITYRNPSEFNLAKGVIEATFIFNRGAAAYQGYARLCFGNGVDGTQISINATDLSVRLYDDANPRYGTLLTTLVNNTEHTFKLVLDNGIGSVYMDGVLLASNIASSTMYYSANTSFWHQASQNANKSYSVWKSVKLKLGRTA